MLMTPDKIPVRTRLPFAAWAIAAVVTLASLISSLVHAYDPSPAYRAQQRVRGKRAHHRV
jgi:hypothetical protein